MNNQSFESIYKIATVNPELLLEGATVEVEETDYETRIVIKTIDGKIALALSKRFDNRVRVFSDPRGLVSRVIPELKNDFCLV